MESPGQWLEGALLDLCKQMETGLDLDKDIISGLVSYCELAQPVDAKEYLDVIQSPLPSFDLPYRNWPFGMSPGSVLTSSFSYPAPEFRVAIPKRPPWC